MNLSLFRIFILLTCLIGFTLTADESDSSDKEKKCEKKVDIQELSRTEHQITVDKVKFSYEAVCGMLPLIGSDDTSKASMYYTAYFKKKAPEASRSEQTSRPIFFCFNGGPGSSSLWLHMGLLGPKKAVVRDAMFTPPPATYEDNPYTLLDRADLVFIDPVSTGFSKTVSGVDGKQYHSVEGDIESFAEFIRLFLTHFQRWDSPRYLIGESYGTIRAVGLANHLHDALFIDLNGIALVSMCLDFQAYDFGSGNDLPYILTLPSYAVTSWYHKKLPPQQQKKSLKDLIAEVEDFALHEYATALLLGESIDPDEKNEIVTRLSQYTGLSAEFIRLSHLRILNNNYYHELLKNEFKVVGRFDGRYIGYDTEHLEEPTYLPDPSFESVTGPFTSAFQQYLSQELKVKRSDPYLVLNTDVFPWNFTVNRVPAGLGYVYMSGKLRMLLEKNPSLKVFVASGYYDLATPYFAANYTLNHLKLDPSFSQNIEQHCYEAGHMMYLNPPSHAQMKQDLLQFLSTPKKKAVSQ